MLDASQNSDTFQRVLHGLQRNISKDIPFSLLYDAKGSALYEQIVELEEYYPYAAESELLKLHAARIARTIPPDSLIAELGCGTATKSAYLLNALQALHGRCQYVGIDVSGSALKQAHKNLLEHVQGLSPSNLHFIEDEYMDALKQLRQRFPHKFFCIMWIGSSVGNLADDDAVSFMEEVLRTVGPMCQFFLCTDLWKDEGILYNAYCDRKGLTEKFIKNGMKNALSLLGYAATQEEEDSWSYHVQINTKLRRVEMCVIFPEGLHIEDHQVHIRSGETVLVELSRKFTIQDVQELATKSNFYIQEAWRNHAYSCQMLCSGLQALLSCWDDTDALFDGISDWCANPIDLRHPFLFYYGHVSAFAKLKLFGRDESSELDVMFSRGIDPCVLDPSKCHEHPKPPPEWPSREHLCAYVRRVRSMVMKAMEDGTVSMHHVCFILEHERMHQETLAYMVVQQTKAEFERELHANLEGERKFHAESMQHGNILKQHEEGLNNDHNRYNGKIAGKPNTQDVLILPGKTCMGLQPSDSVFVWDNEQPMIETIVSEPFVVSSKAVSIREYMTFVENGGYGREELWETEDHSYFKHKGYRWPATWSHLGGEFYVHGQGTTRHWSAVAEEPVYVSLAEAEAYCKWAGNFRVMSEEEYHKALPEEGRGLQGLREGGWEWTSSPFVGFPGFKAMAEYEEYSVDFFDGKHFVLKGSSPATHPALIRDSFRNFYQRQYRFMFAKFRCCKSLPNQSLPRADTNGSCSDYRSAVFGHV